MRGHSEAPGAVLSVETWRHRATLVEISERKFQKTTSGDGLGAFLRKRTYVAVRVPVEQYTLVTPPLDQHLPTDEDNPPDGNSRWLRSGGEDVLFHIIGEGWVGKRHEFTAPLIFVGANEAFQPGTMSTLVDFYNTNVPPNSLDANSGGALADSRRTRMVSGRIAFAAPRAGGGADTTSQDARSLAFGATSPADGSSGWRWPFRVVVREFEVFSQTTDGLPGYHDARRLTYAEWFVV